MLRPAPENQRRVISVNCMEMNHARVGEGGVLWGVEREEREVEGKPYGVEEKEEDRRG